MKKTMLTMLVLAVTVLSGCGQNVETIKADFAAVSQSSGDKDFAGYTLLVSKVEQEKINQFNIQNRLPRSIEYGEEYVLADLPTVSFKNDTYEQIVALRQQAGETIRKIKAEAESIAAQRREDLTASIKKYEQDNADIEASMSEYRALFATEQAAYDAAKQQVDDVVSQRKAYEEAFYTKYKQIVLDHSLPIDVDKKIMISNYYTLMSQRKCQSQDQSKVTYVENAQGGCIYVSFQPENSVLEPIFREYGVYMHQSYRQSEDAKKVAYAAEQDLGKAKIIAKNKTRVDERQLLSMISKNQTNIDKLNRSLVRETDVSYITTQLFMSNGKMDEINHAYANAVKKYQKDVMLASFDRADIQVAEFDDEEALPAITPGDRGFALYVFTGDNDTQYVLVAKLSDKKTDRNFASIFKDDAEFIKPKSAIEDGQDAVNAIKALL